MRIGCVSLITKTIFCMLFMRFVSTCMLCLGLLFITQSAKAQSVAEAYPAIAKTVNYYLEGGTNNDFQTLKKAFHETASMKYMNDGAYTDVNRPGFIGDKVS